MKEKYIMFICFIVVTVNFINAESITNKIQNIAELLWTANDEQYKECLSGISEVPVEKYNDLLVAIYKSTHFNYEGASMIMGFVTREFMKQIDINDMRLNMIDILKRKDACIELKRYVLQGITSWAEEDTIAVCNELDQIATPDSELWFHIQNGIARLIQSRNSEANRQSNTKTTNQLSKFSGIKIKNIMSDLLKYEPGDKMYEICIGKTISKYRRIVPGDTDAALINALTEIKMSTSKQLEILERMCSRRAKTKVVANHVKNLKVKAIKDNKTLTAEDEKRAEKLLKHHEVQ